MNLKKLKKWQKIILTLGICVLVLASAGGYFYFKNTDSVIEDVVTGKDEIVPAPNVEGKIKGYWSSRGGMVLSELDDAEEMKEVGINTVTFSPTLSHTQEGKIIERSSAEPTTKKAINKAHKAGFRVMLETTPMNAGEVDPKVKNPELFQNEMTKIAVKYAKIAEEYHVEYFAPIVEPGHHMSIAEADGWLQELLPKLKEVYSGPVMWKKQSMHLTEAKEWNQDHIMTVGFKLDSYSMQIGIKNTSEHKITLNVRNNKVQLEEYSGNSKKFNKERGINIEMSAWHILRVEVIGQKINVFIDNQLMIEHIDDSGPIGGYSLSSQGTRINQFEITDVFGSSLLAEDFKSLKNWGAKSGWTLGSGEIIITSQTETKLLHDIDFSGYDYIAIDTFKRGKVNTNEEYVEELKFVIKKTNEQAESDGVPNVIIAEFGGSVEKEIGWIDVDERAKIPMTTGELAQVTKMVLKLAEGTVDGYMYNGWDIEGQGINRVPEVKQVIKEWYNSH